MKTKIIEIEEQATEELNFELKKVCYLWLKKHKLDKRHLDAFFWFDKEDVNLSIHYQLKIGNEKS